MNQDLKDRFISRWETYFPGAELPIAFYYTDDASQAQLVAPPEGRGCLMAQLNDVRRGESLSFNVNSIACSGGKRYTGFSQQLMPNFEYFLSCGIPGQMEGERYKKSPDIVREMMRKAPSFVAPAPFIVFKRWDKLEATDDPAAVIFYATPDVLAGLFTLANFDRVEPDGVFSPMGAGCATIIQYPYFEREKDEPRAVIGLFDLSARPWVKRDIITFAVPINKFTCMVADMDQSFLTTPTWDRIKARMEG